MISSKALVVDEPAALGAPTTYHTIHPVPPGAVRLSARHIRIERLAKDIDTSQSAPAHMDIDTLSGHVVPGASPTDAQLESGEPSKIALSPPPIEAPQSVGDNQTSLTGIFLNFCSFVSHLNYVH